jgi:class 3 adenylate cyclase/tetratricopeptide (TPR) repeat protein
VTVLFCDIVDSTGQGESTDPEVVRSRLARFFEQMKTIVERHGGTVEKFIGDAVMAVFGVPRVYEDDALRACRAAIEMREALPLLGIEGRIGLMTGEVVTGTEERLATGDAVNVAARLEQAAGAGEVLIGKPTLELVRGAVEVEPLEPLELKGKAQPVTAYRLKAVRDPDARPAETPFVGRGEELAAIRAAWERALTDQRCQLVTVVGEAGIGKSRLVAEALASVEAQIVQGRCLPYGEGITYWPVVEVIKQLETLPADRVAASAIASLLGQSESGPTSAEEIASAFRKLLEERAPLVVVFDDIQWGEATFLDLLEHVALLSTQSPILLLCIARPELAEGGRPWSVTLSLEPLPDAAVDELIGGRVAAEVRERIARAAGGNPLFVSEMLTMAQQTAGEVTVPPTLRALVAARLDQLDNTERRVLERAAVEGEIFHRGSVRALGPEETQVTPQLASLVRKGLIRPEKSEFEGEDGFRFRHLLLRDAAYDSLPKAKRADLHERFAAWLEGRSVGRPELDEILGYHLEQSYRYRAELGHRDDAVATLGKRAAQHLGEAGKRALAGGDVAAAANLLVRASASLDDADPARVDLLASVGMARTAAGELETALEALNEAVERAEINGDRRTRWRAAAERARISFITGGIGPDEARAEAEAAISELEALDDDLGLTKAWLLLVFVHNWRLEYSALDGAADRARLHAQRAGAAVDAADALAWIAPATVLGPRHVESGISHMERIRSDAPGPLAEAAALVSLGCLRLMAGQTQVGRDLYQRSEALYRDLGVRLLAAAQATLTGWSELVAGDATRAEAQLRAGYAEFEEMGERGLLSSTAAELGRVLCKKGSYDEAEKFATTSEELSGPGDAFNLSLIAGIRARVLAARDEGDKSIQAAEEAVARSAGDCVELSADAYRALAVSLRSTGRHDDAETALHDALGLYNAKGNLVAAERVREALAHQIA